MKRSHPTPDPPIYSKLPKPLVPSPVHVSSLPLIPQEIVQANEEIRLGADLASKYRKNAQFNIEALRASGTLPSDFIGDPGGAADDQPKQTRAVDDHQP